MKERSVGNTVLVVDGGGRGATLVNKYAQSEYVERIIAVPGNDLMKINTDKPVQIYPQLKTTSIPEILEICEREGVNLVDVSQDNAVSVGLVDALQELGVPVIGPTKAAGKIEWSKVFSREFGVRQGIPQPSFRVCYSEQEGVDFLHTEPDQPWFVKADGLAEGKGALPAKSNAEAIARIPEMRRFKDAGRVYLLEKWLKGDAGREGEEFSTYVFSDGENIKFIGNAQDHKRANDFDEGENTGGMGCSTPPLALTEGIMRRVREGVIDKAIAGLNAEGRPYKGVLYLGGMLVSEGGQQNPYVIEFNARWGDPEVQVVLPGLKNDLFEIGMAIAAGDIKGLELETDGKARVVVTGASRGYPGNYDTVKGKRIYGLNEARKIDGVRLYGAGVKDVDGKHYASGGRLFYLVGEGQTVIEARLRAYEAMSIVFIEGNNLHYRTDIGWRDVARLRSDYR
ncbi:MAG: phosphoribosylamine--glycine ligase [bacterium]|nr:phosphoribosylamine--glycine ligase [bacterium]